MSCAWRSECRSGNIERPEALRKIKRSDNEQRLLQPHRFRMQREALLAELQRMPQDEIARQLGSNRNALHKLTHDARKRLRQGLETAGFTAEDIGAAFPM
jgi:DNA-directed RNA polymerase specialized sigma24 family protein